MFRGQVSRLLLLRGIWYFIVLQSVAVPFFISRGLNSTQIFTVQAIFLLTLCLLDIPTSLIAVRWGIKRSLLVGCALKGAGGTLLLIDAGPASIYASYFLIAAGNAFFFGLDYTLLFNQVPQGPAMVAGLEKLQGKAHAIMLLCVTVSGLIGAAIAQAYGFEALVLLNAILAWASFVCGLSLKDSRGALTHVPNAEILAAAWRIIIDASRSRYVILVVLAELVPAILPYLIQFRMTDAGDGLLAIGVVIGFQNAWGALCALAFARFQGTAARRFLSSVTVIVLLWLLSIGALTLSWGYAIFAAVVAAEIARAVTAVYVNADFQLSFDGPLRPAVASVNCFLARLSAVACVAAFAYATSHVSLNVLCGLFAVGILLLTGTWLAASRKPAHIT